MTHLRQVHILDANGNPLEAVSALIPQLKTTLYDVNGNPISETSRLAITGIDHAHDEIHEGNFYNCGHYDNAVASAANLDILIITGATYGLHFSPLITAGGDVEFRLYEDTTVSANGSALTPWNARRSSSNTTESEHYHTPTVTGVGTQLGPTHFIPGGSGPFGVGGSGGGPVRAGTEIIFNINKNYLLRVTNISGGNTQVNIEYGYYESFA